MVLIWEQRGMTRHGLQKVRSHDNFILIGMFFHLF